MGGFGNRQWPYSRFNCRKREGNFKMRPSLKVPCERGSTNVEKVETTVKNGEGNEKQLSIVMKFGGSSLASAERMREVADLILSFPKERPIIVLSAMDKTTNQLLLAGEKAVCCGAANSSDIEESSSIKELHLKTVEELGLDVIIIAGLTCSLLSELGLNQQLEWEVLEIGTVWTATAHIVSAVIGSGVLAHAWSVAQLGWIVGPLVLVGFSWVSYYTSTLLANCYRHPDPIRGEINHTYIDLVRSYLGPRHVFAPAWVQYANQWATLVGYTITAATSMIAGERLNCFHRKGHEAICKASGNMLILGFGLTQVGLSQFLSLENISWLSVVAVATTFCYSFIWLVCA